MAVAVRVHTFGERIGGFESTLGKGQCKLSLRDQILLPIVEDQPANEGMVFTSVEVGGKLLAAADLMRPCNDYVSNGELVVVVGLEAATGLQCMTSLVYHDMVSPIDIAILPPLPGPDVRTKRVQSLIGLVFITGVTAVLWYITEHLLGSLDASSAHVVHLAISSQAVISLICLAVLLINACTMRIGRTPENCSPMPDAVAQTLRVSGDASALPNIYDRARNRSYCTRCFVWRNADGHHCRVCGVCVSHFDHHCVALGVCVCGSICPPRGNKPWFASQILMAATALLTLLSVRARHCHKTHGHKPSHNRPMRSSAAGRESAWRLHPCSQVPSSLPSMIMHQLRSSGRLEGLAIGVSVAVIVVTIVGWCYVCVKRGFLAFFRCVGYHGSRKKHS